MSKTRLMEYAVVLFLVLLFATGCAFKRAALKRELNHMLTSLPESLNSALLSEVWDYGGGSDSRCDGYLVSRLYGTNEPMEHVIEFVEDQVLSLGMWSFDPRLPRRETEITLINQDGYLLSVGDTQLDEETLRNPFFKHKDVSPDQPYKTLYLFVIVHIDASNTDHCWGH